MAGTIAPVVAAAEPVLDDRDRQRGHADHDVAGTIAPVVAAAEPVLDDRDRQRGHADR